MPRSKTKDKISSTTLFLLGMSLLLVSNVTHWNDGLLAGLWSFFLAIMIIAFGFSMFVFSLAELTSTVAFTGGAFGYARCSLGPLWGYMVGCCELLLYNAYTITSLLMMGHLVCDSSHIDPKFESLVSLSFLALIAGLHLLGQERAFWWMQTSCAVITLVICTMYVLSEFLGHSHKWDFSLTDTHAERFEGGAKEFFHDFYLAAFFFLGIEAIVVVGGGRMERATQSLPKVLVTCFFAAAALIILVFFATVILYQDLDFHSLAHEEYPLSAGLAKYFFIGADVSHLLLLPSGLAAASGFFHTSQHIAFSMAQSGLLPAGLTKVHLRGDVEVPWVAITTCAVVQYALLLLGWWLWPLRIFFELSLLGACLVYIGLCSSYLIFSTKFSGMKRTFYSPVGRVGAMLGAFVFTILLATLLIFHQDDYLVVLLVGYLLGFAIYYFAVVEGRQFFSAEEQKHFLKAYILNVNKAKKKQLSWGQQVWLRVRANICGCACWRWIGLSFMAISEVNSQDSSANGSKDTKNSHSRLSQTSQQALVARLASLPRVPVSVVKSNRVLPDDLNAAVNSDVLQEETPEGGGNKDGGMVRPAHIASLTIDIGAGHALARTNRVAPDASPLPGAGIRDVLSLAVEDGGSSSMKLGTVTVPNTSVKLSLTWSGQVMNLRQSQQFFQLLDTFESDPGLFLSGSHTPRHGESSPRHHAPSSPRRGAPSFSRAAPSPRHSSTPRHAPSPRRHNPDEDHQQASVDPLPIVMERENSTTFEDSAAVDPLTNEDIEVGDEANDEQTRTLTAADQADAIVGLFACVASLLPDNFHLVDSSDEDAPVEQSSPV